MSAQGPSGDEVFAVGAALLAGLSALEERGPVVVVIDDLHWADAGSARALLFCLRRLRADPVLALLATRPHALEGLGESWARLLADGERVRHVRLSGLSAEEVRELAAVDGRELPGAAAARLQEHTGGNPLYVRALLAELPEEALLGGLTHMPAPRGVRGGRARRACPALARPRASWCAQWRCSGCGLRCGSPRRWPRCGPMQARWTRRCGPGCSTSPPVGAR